MWVKGQEKINLLDVIYCEEYLDDRENRDIYEATLKLSKYHAMSPINPLH